jgi:glutathione synthase/RimK-type ligase-like ATP-grasp enzyme
MTKVLIITNTTDFTSDYVIRSLESIKAEYYRLNTDEIGNQVYLTFDFVHDKFTLFDKPKNLKLDLQSISAVYFRRPEVPTFSGSGLSTAEKQFMSLEVRQTLEGLYKILRDAFWISDIDSIRRAENKIFQQLIAKEIGCCLPAGIITNQPKQFSRFVKENRNDCIVKPIFSGRIGWPEMERVVYTSELKHIPSAQQIEFCPTYIQNRLKKKFDIRVTVVGEEVFAVRIHSQSNPETQTDWRLGDNLLKHEIIELPCTIVNQCRELLRRLNLKFGAIDFVETVDDKFVFLEINPNGQWGWIQAQTGMPISDTIVKLLTNEHLSKSI